MQYVHVNSENAIPTLSRIPTLSHNDITGLFIYFFKYSVSCSFWSFSPCITPLNTANMSSLPLLGDLLQGDYMKCPLCHNTYSEPVILPCLHSTCLGCIRNHLAEVKGQGSSTDSSEGLTKEAAQLRCPVCQEGEFEFHGQQLVGWSPNYFLVKQPIIARLFQAITLYKGNLFSNKLRLILGLQIGSARKCNQKS